MSANELPINLFHITYVDCLVSCFMYIPSLTTPSLSFQWKGHKHCLSVHGIAVAIASTKKLPPIKSGQVISIRALVNTPCWLVSGYEEEYMFGYRYVHARRHMRQK